MRATVILACLSLLPSLGLANDLKVEDKIELTRGLVAEYATAKVLLPRSKKPLEFNADGTWDKNAWAELARQSGPAARSGDSVQITKISIDEDKLVLEINHGLKKGGHWYDHVQVGMGGTVGPVGQPGYPGDSNAASGTYIAILFHKPLEPMKASDVKKMLAPILDFERRTATELYVDTLTPEMKQAVQEKRVIVGMTREQVILAVGRPVHKSRETNKEGVEEESWVYGNPPGKITFVTFVGEKVTKVKDEYAGLGTEVADPPVPR
ncbi:MAG TPA: hypothetical protein VKV17_22190 [Bryobacteraceae bacterium]|nr:hypothetical protein [Bryobacteraceae bacterium]